MGTSGYVTKSKHVGYQRAKG